MEVLSHGAQVVNTAVAGAQSVRYESAMRNIFGLIILVLDIVAIIDCLKSGMSVGKKVLWVVLILLLPIVGLVLYYLLGRKSA